MQPSIETLMRWLLPRCTKRKHGSMIATLGSKALDATTTFFTKFFLDEEDFPCFVTSDRGRRQWGSLSSCARCFSPSRPEVSRVFQELRPGRKASWYIRMLPPQGPRPHRNSHRRFARPLFSQLLSGQGWNAVAVTSHAIESSRFDRI
jgi:hypothetical protein